MGLPAGWRWQAVAKVLKSPSFETLVASPWAFRPQKPDGLLREGGILWGVGSQWGCGWVGGGLGQRGGKESGDIPNATLSSLEINDSALGGLAAVLVILMFPLIING